MKKELITYDYYCDPSTQPTMMVANGHAGFHSVHPFNFEDDVFHMLGKNHINFQTIVKNATSVVKRVKLNRTFV